MKPITINDCHGWLHDGYTSHGVVICGALGHEALWTHKLTRALAEHLANRGVWALRFDYPCAGDSLGHDDEDGRFARSLESVQRAIAFLRAQTPVTHLTLVGVRAGALFATLAACGAGQRQPPEVDALALLAPVVSGKAYLRELARLARQWLDYAPPPVREAHRAGAGLTVLGHDYPVDLVERIKTVNLCDVVGAARSLPRSCWLIDAPYGDADALAAALGSRGVAVESEVSNEMSCALDITPHSRLPSHMIDATTDWVARNAASVEPVMHRQAQPACDANGANDVNDGRGSAGFVTHEMVERVVTIGPNRLAGVLCTPTGLRSPLRGAPALLIASTASNPRAGDARHAVNLARHLADLGITSLRFDTCHVGDSGLQAADDQSGVPYSEQSIADVVAAADWLAQQGYGKVVAMGVCSGAYASLQAATRSPVVTGVVAINLSRFVWPRGLMLSSVQKVESTRGYLMSVRSWRKWKHLVTAPRDPRPILRVLWRQASARFQVPLMDLAQRAGWQAGADTERGVMQTLARRNVRTLLVYGEYDKGVDDLTRHFGPARRAFKGSCHVRVHIVPELDHSLYEASGRNTVTDLSVRSLTEWFCEDSEISEALSPSLPARHQASFSAVAPPATGAPLIRTRVGDE
ncbi:MAG: alpha/beta hydrolase [Paraburkholderia sp.]|nr:alpha/beta hydrolase [Paraburkholderia sp.]